MFKNYLQSIKGVETFGIIGLIAFLLFFVAMIIWLVKIDKRYIDEMKNLPLEPDNNENLNLTGETNEK